MCSTRIHELVVSETKSRGIAHPKEITLIRRTTELVSDQKRVLAAHQRSRAERPQRYDGPLSDPIEGFAASALPLNRRRRLAADVVRHPVPAKEASMIRDDASYAGILCHISAGTKRDRWPMFDVATTISEIPSESV